jgi:hypothetical protein
MKKNLLTCLVLSVLSVTAFSQEPTTRWPYLFPEFKTGFVEISEGTTISYALNIHLRHGQLHYLDADGIIKEATIEEVIGAQVGSDRFLQVKGEMMHVVAQSEHGCVVEEVLGDFAALNETGGAYGSSSQTSATRKLSSIETDSQINQNHMILMQSRSDGKMLDLLKTYYFVYPGYVVKATRSEVEGIIPADRADAWKTWKKTHKVKWNQPESLISLLDFLNP